jgi:biotin synthase
MQITLSCGEQEEKLYEKWKKAGADRYLLKIESSNKKLYEKLHPEMSFDGRLNCLRVLKKLGYQTGSGIIIGLKDQTLEDIAGDIVFFSKEDFDMIGINPFIAHSESMLKNHPGGDPFLTVKTVALTRIITKNAHLPATTALGSIGDTDLRILALKAGANVIMPNFTPYEQRKQYEIYPNKRCLSEDENIMGYLNNMAAQSGRTLDFSKGDSFKTSAGSSVNPKGSK